MERIILECIKFKVSELNRGSILIILLSMEYNMEEMEDQIKGQST